MGLRIPFLFSAYQVWVNGREISRSGTPGASAREERPDGSPGTGFFIQDSDELHIRIRVSNYHGPVPGMRGGVPEYGSAETLLERQSLRAAGEILLPALFFLAALAWGILWRRFSRNPPVLFLGFLFFGLEGLLRTGGLAALLASLGPPGLLFRGRMIAGLFSAAFLVLVSPLPPGTEGDLGRRRGLIFIPPGVLGLAALILPGGALPFFLPLGPVLFLAAAVFFGKTIFSRRRELGRVPGLVLTAAGGLLCLGALSDLLGVLGFPSWDALLPAAEGLFCLSWLVRLPRHETSGEPEKALAPPEEEPAAEGGMEPPEQGTEPAAESTEPAEPPESEESAAEGTEPAAAESQEGTEPAAESAEEGMEPPEEEDEEALEIPPLPLGITAGWSLTILICSPDPSTRKILKNQLTLAQYSVEVHQTGMGALEAIAEDLPDMVIVDSELPDMPGDDVCRELRESYGMEELPIIMLLNDNQRIGVMECLAAGANDYLKRPYQQEECLARINTHLQLSRMNLLYSQFVPKEFLECLGQDKIIDIKLGDHVQKEMTILFVDIRSFTNLSENMTPQENFKFINSYLGQFTPLITKNHGFVDKFIGDAIMALYPYRPEDAIRTAIEMVENVKVYNQGRLRAGYQPINIGVGIHTGYMILGIIGDSKRMQGTVISDAVNLASRIQDMCKYYRTNVVISRETFLGIQDLNNYSYRFLGQVKVKGKNKTVALFEIFNADDESIRQLKEKTQADFETGLRLFSKSEFEDAKQYFEKVCEANGHDETAKVFLDKAGEFALKKKRSFLTSL
jgi:class 3 adenylate cyclase/CheY-like chemotaxis protein